MAKSILTDTTNRIYQKPLPPLRTISLSSHPLRALHERLLPIFAEPVFVAQRPRRQPKELFFTGKSICLCGSKSPLQGELIPRGANAVEIFGANPGNIMKNTGITKELHIKRVDLPND